MTNLRAWMVTGLTVTLAGCNGAAPVTEAPISEGPATESRSALSEGSPTAADLRAAMAHPTCAVGAARWGAFDQAGQSNTQTPDKMLDASGFIRPGSRQITLGHGYDDAMPTFHFPTLTGYHLEIPDHTHRLALGPLVAQEELVTGEIGQVGTEIDALGHMCFLHGGATDIGDADCYAGFKERDIYDSHGLLALGVEHIKPYFTRGILLDVERYVNDNVRLAPGTAVTVEMIAQTMAAEHLSVSDIREGDVVLIRTGQEELWHHPELGDYYGSTPGINLETARFFASRCIGNIGADNWPVEVQPSVDGGFVPVHEYDLTVVGWPQQENLSLKELADYLAGMQDANRYLFAYVYTPVPLTGATGSLGVPIAVK